MASHETVISKWYANKPANGYAMHSTGEFLYSHNKVIGRTLGDGTKQLLALIDVYTVSTSTRKHLTYAMRGGEHELLFPQIKHGYETDNDFAMSWELLDFPSDDYANTLRYTKQTWKTFKGAYNAAKRINRGDLFPKAVYGGYSLFFPQFILENGHVGTNEEYYNQ